MCVSNNTGGAGRNDKRRVVELRLQPPKERKQNTHRTAVLGSPEVVMALNIFVVEKFRAH